MFKKAVLPLAWLAMAMTALVLAYRAGHPLQAYLFHADSLYLPTLFANLFAGSGSLSDWYLTPAPYFFPDYPLYLVAYLLGHGPYQQILLFALLQSGLTVVALYTVVRNSSDGYRFATATLIALLLIWLSVNASEPYVELLTSAYHFGAFLSGLAFVGAWLALERGGDGGARRLLLPAMCLLAFLTALSDNIFLVQTIVPFVVTWVLLHRNGQGARRLLTVPAAVLLAGILGSLAYKFVVIHSTRYPTKLGVAQLGTSLNDLMEILSRLFVALPLLGLVVTAYFLFGVACLVTTVRKRSFLDLPRPLVLLVTFSMIGTAATLGAVLLVSNLPVSPRYLIPALLWPVIISVLLLQHWLGTRFFWVGTYASGILALVLFASAVRMPTHDNPGYYPEQLACIDKALAGKSLHKGIAQYWDAKHFQMFSQQPITLAQYVSDMTPHKWITSERFYAEAYDFAIIAEDGGEQFKLPEDKLVAINGAPAERVACGNRTLLIYGPNKLRLKKFMDQGSAFTWKGCELPTLVGKPTAACEAEKSDPAQEGFLTFGPYDVLPAGEYAFELVYASSKPAAEAAGEWDVALALPTEAKRLLGGRIDGTAGEQRQITGQFSIEPKFDQTKIEIRTMAGKGGTMKVISLRLTRTR